MPYRTIRSRSCSGLGGSSADRSWCNLLVSVRSRSVKHEEASGCVPGTSEGVGLPFRHPPEIARAGGHGRPFEFDVMVPWRTVHAGICWPKSAHCAGFSIAGSMLARQSQLDGIVGGGEPITIAISSPFFRTMVEIGWV
jgi:hypothetical protein